MARTCIMVCAAPVRNLLMLRQLELKDSANELLMAALNHRLYRDIARPHPSPPLISPPLSPVTAVKY